MKLKQLINIINHTDASLTKKASKSINRYLTMRNWLIGYRIYEYEQAGEDRAAYGDNLIKELSRRLQRKNIPSCSTTYLKIYRQFYLCYPQIRQILSRELKTGINQEIIGNIPEPSIGQTTPDQSKTHKNQEVAQSTPTFPTSPTISDQLLAYRLLNSLPFSSFVELIKINDPLKRNFYEVECLRGQWSSRELRRQIGSLYYERSAHSINKEKLSKLENENINETDPKNFIRDPYIFEFLRLKPHEALRENNIRDALLDKLQEFLLEMGKGFCFEARNKRILIGDDYYFIDIVLYHRILKCNVIIELKLSKVSHENIGQLNTYLSYYKRNEMHEGDKPPYWYTAMCRTR